MRFPVFSGKSAPVRLPLPCRSPFNNPTPTPPHPPTHASPPHPPLAPQNFFRAYPKLAGMTGTAATESAEFSQIYNLPVTVVPPNRTVSRTDNPDVVFRWARPHRHAHRRAGTFRAAGCRFWAAGGRNGQLNACSNGLGLQRCAAAVMTRAGCRAHVLTRMLSTA